MRSGDEDIAHMREEYDSRRRYLVENLNRIGPVSYTHLYYVKRQCLSTRKCV